MAANNRNFNCLFRKCPGSTNILLEIATKTVSL